MFQEQREGPRFDVGTTKLESDAKSVGRIGSVCASFMFASEQNPPGKRTIRYRNIWFPWVSDVVEAPAEILFMGCSAIDARETACPGCMRCRSTIVATDSLEDVEAK